MNERAEAERDEGTDGKKKKARDAHVIRQGVCVWGGGYEVESGKKGRGGKGRGEKRERGEKKEGGGRGGGGGGVGVCGGGVMKLRVEKGE